MKNTLSISLACSKGALAMEAVADSDYTLTLGELAAVGFGIPIGRG